MKIVYFLLISSLLIFYSCDEPNVVPIQYALPSPSVLNHWQEIESADHVQLEGNTYTTLKLNVDSTYQLTYHTWTDVRKLHDPCRDVDMYYTKGKFSIDREYLYFHGCYSDSTFIHCIARCDGKSDFSDSFRYAIQNDTLTLTAVDNQTEIKHLIKK